MRKSQMISGFITVFLTSVLCTAQDRVIIPDLSKISTGDEWNIHNREVTITKQNDQLNVELDAKTGNGIVWLKNTEFTNGIIEADIKGKNVQGLSFVGIAFRGVDEKTFDAIYFRPFNFMSEDPVRQGHGVQYISHPEYTWYRLRQESPEKYENPVNPTPDPNAFFHAKIVVDKPKIKVYVNNAAEPCLAVDELSSRKDGWIGFFVGNGSDGTFANLKIIPARD